MVLSSLFAYLGISTLLPSSLINCTRRLVWGNVVQIAGLKQVLRQVRLAIVLFGWKISVAPLAHGVVVRGLRLRLAQVEHVIFQLLHQPKTRIFLPKML